MSYTVVYERHEDGYWTAAVKEVRGCHTQGRSLEQTRARIREALSLFVDDAETAELVADYRLPKDMKRMLRRAVVARKRAEAVEAEATSSLRAAVEALRSNNVSVRDASAMLGLSHQRIHQIAASAPRAKSRRSSRRVI